MWLLDRLWPTRTAAAVPPAPPAEASPRRALFKRPLRAGRTRMAPWQKVAPPPRRRGH